MPRKNDKDPSPFKVTPLGTENSPGIAYAREQGYQSRKTAAQKASERQFDAAIRHASRADERRYRAETRKEERAYRAQVKASSEQKRQQRQDQAEKKREALRQATAQARQRREQAKADRDQAAFQRQFRKDAEASQRAQRREDEQTRSAAQRFADRRKRAEAQAKREDQAQLKARFSAAKGLSDQEGGRLGKTATALGERVTSLPTPGGAFSLFMLILVFLFAIVPVNAGYTRLQLIFFTLLGRTSLPGENAAGFGDTLHSVNLTPQQKAALGIVEGTGNTLATAQSDLQRGVIDTGVGIGKVISDLPKLPFGLPG